MKKELHTAQKKLLQETAARGKSCCSPVWLSPTVEQMSAPKKGAQQDAKLAKYRR